jgi:DNA uptake protein ComE-like DNA-binding protein
MSGTDIAEGRGATMKTPTCFALALTVLALGCDPTTDTPDSEPRLALASHEAAAILELVNAADTDLSLLDNDAKLDARAAENIIDLRNGPDGVYPTLDDYVFESMEDLDAVPYVGNSALAALRDFALTYEPTPGALIEGVQFSGKQAQAVLWGVNQADVDYLDAIVELDPRAANELVENAPYADLQEIADIAYVGSKSLQKLRHHANTWMVQMGGDGDSQAGTYDGVVFDDATAANALELANEETFQDLVDAGMWTTGARRIVENRPYTSLADVAAVIGVGESTMADLKALAGGE